MPTLANVKEKYGVYPSVVPPGGLALGTPVVATKTCTINGVFYFAEGDKGVVVHYSDAGLMFVRFNNDPFEVWAAVHKHNVATD